MPLLLASLREAVLTMLAALASMALAWMLDPEPGSLVLAVVLSLALSRSRLDRDLKGRIEASFALPLVSLGALGMGLLLVHRPWLGAAAFVLAMSLSVALRRFGPTGRKAGTLITLPCIVLLIAPRLHSRSLSPAMTLAMPVIVAIIALICVSLSHSIGHRLGWLQAPVSEKLPTAAPPTTRGSRLQVSDKMALQMAVALGAAFVLGYLLFAEHWAWLVLTAYIVGSSNQGRLDVAYKAVLRVLGAASGTVLALLAAPYLDAAGSGSGVVILLALFMGLWLRPLGYAWWALFITIALALLQGMAGVGPQGLLLTRLTEIVIGALVGVAAAWFVLPVNSTDVLRRRIADALAVLADAQSAERFLAQLEAVDKVAAAFRAARWVSKRWYPSLQPADWVDELMACRGPAVRVIQMGRVPGLLRQSIGAARQAMREPAKIQPALAALRAALDAADTTMPATISANAAA